MYKEFLLPNFIGIGVQRAATTWFYECLKEHPDVFVPDKKEIHFFDEEYRRGLEWYSNHFNNSKGYKAVGELTPNYIDNIKAIPRMAEVIPDARLFIIFRDPVERAFSSYNLLRQEHWGKMTFKEACQHSDYLLRLSLYSENLQQVFNYYDKQQVKIFLFDDVRVKKYEVIKESYSFLGVDDSFVPFSINRVYNAILMPKFQNILYQFKLGNIVDLYKKTILGKLTKDFLIALQKNKHEKTNHSKVDQQANIEDFEFKRELRKYFRDDILRLEKLINRDLSVWLEN